MSFVYMKVKVPQSCPTLSDPMDYTVHGVGSHSLLQGIFPTQGSNPSLLHRRQILYQLSYQGSPKGAGHSDGKARKGLGESGPRDHPEPAGG